MAVSAKDYCQIFYFLLIERVRCLSKKIIVVTKNMHGGGAERVIAQLVNYLTSINIECMIIMTDDEPIGYDLNEKVKVMAIGRKSQNKLVDRLKRYKTVRKIVKKEKPDLVLSLPEDTGIYVLWGLLGCRVPVYVSERNNPWVMPDVKITRILRRLMYPFAKGIIFQTEMAKSFFSKRIQKKGIVLPNPVDAGRIPEPFNGEREKIIVGAGRLSRQKNFPLLINAFAEFSNSYPDYRLIIYGEGPDRHLLEEQIRTLGIEDKVELPGRQNNLPELMNTKAMFVLSSDYEGMPNVLSEAMCMGMPVISTDCPSGGPRELIRQKENGLLVPVNAQEQLTEALCYMAEGDHAQQMGHEAFRLRSKLTSRKVFEDWYRYLFEDKM